MRSAPVLGLMLLLVPVLAAPAGAQSVIISEMADPHLNYLTDRFIEIANTGASAVDLTGWTLVAVGNGANIFTWNLSGSILPGDALVAGDQTLTVAFPVDFPSEGWSDSNGTWNGKVGDGAKLLNASAVIVDYAVVDNTRFENEDYVRNVSVTSPSVVYDPNQWTATPIEYPTDGTPGTHGSNPPAGPSIGNVQTAPSSPAAGQTVQVSADITDTENTLTGAEVHWGTVSYSLTHIIAMSVQSGDTWVTTGSIPGQSGGVTVYYEVEAFDDAPASETSGIYSYTLSGGPPDYYASAAGLAGVPLRAALHAIIDNHTVRSYDFALTAFQTTDDKPNGKVWDMYSDNPGGSPPYEYTFVVDEGASASGEGQGYNREHSWPRSWFGGAVSPMNSDLFQLYPADIYVNSMRANYPYGEVSSPTFTSTNGSRLGPNSYPGYSGTVFEPIDAYKGDFARSYFYMTVRYYTEDGSWPGSDMTDGADLLPWAVNMLLEWNQADPVSAKEQERNETIYGFQDNRNPFIDHPEYAQLIYGDASGIAEPVIVRFLAAAPNPFRRATTIQFDLDRATQVHVEVFDLQGRIVRSLESGWETEGNHRLTWDGTADGTGTVSGGVYFVRVAAGDAVSTRKVLFLR